MLVENPVQQKTQKIQKRDYASTNKFEARNSKSLAQTGFDSFNLHRLALIIRNAALLDRVPVAPGQAETNSKFEFPNVRNSRAAMVPCN